MVKHYVFFKFKPEATAAERQLLEDALNGLPAKISEIKSWKVVHSLPGRPARFYDLALFAEFEDVAAVDRYLAHPDHQRILPIVEATCAGRAPFNYE